MNKDVYNALKSIFDDRTVLSNLILVYSLLGLFVSPFRTVKNQSTGVDLSVSSIKESPGLVSYKLEYSIIVVTNLQCFKLPQHKENDTVQFVVTISV